MGYKILHAHGYAGPKGKRSYLKFGREFQTKSDAKKWADKNLTSGSYRYVPSIKVGKTGHKSLYYIKK